MDIISKLKGIVLPKMKKTTSFTKRSAVPDVYDFFFFTHLFEYI